jgi:hypothetical protein
VTPTTRVSSFLDPNILPKRRTPRINSNIVIYDGYSYQITGQGELIEMAWMYLCTEILDAWNLFNY